MMNDTATPTTPSAVPASALDDRPGIAFVQLAPSPYRTHIQVRICREIPELKLHSIYTHGFIDGHSWKHDLPAEINPLCLGGPNEVDYETSLKHPIREYRKGSVLVRYIRDNNVRAAIASGYRRHGLRRFINYCHRTGIPCFYFADSNVRNPEPPTIVLRLIKRFWTVPALRKCTGVLSMGELGDQYFDRYGADSSRYFRAPYEPDYDLITGITADEIEAFRRRFDLPAERRYMVYSGRLVDRKRVDLLLDAFVRIADQRPEWDVVILGDGPLRDELVASIPDALAHRVHWLGYLDMDLVPAAYHATDLLVLPSDYEPWAVVVNEAMAAGSPVIASDVVGASWELVRNQGCGRIFPKGDLEALVDALADVTDPGNYPVYQAAVAPALERWRRVADPIDGIRKALAFAGVIPDAARPPSAASSAPA